MFSVLLLLLDIMLNDIFKDVKICCCFLVNLLVFCYLLIWEIFFLINNVCL